MGEDIDGWAEGVGSVALYTVPIVEEDCPLAVLSLDCESVEAVVRKLALDRRRSSLKIDILSIWPFALSLLLSLLCKEDMTQNEDTREKAQQNRSLAPPAGDIAQIIIDGLIEEQAGSEMVACFSQSRSREAFQAFKVGVGKESDVRLQLRIRRERAGARQVRLR